MTRQNALCAALAPLVASFVWDPALLPAAAALGGVAAILAVAVIPAERREEPTVLTRMPTRYEREGHSRWLPGVGVGISPRGGWHPFAFLSIWRYRR